MSKNWTIEDLKSKGLVENNGSYKPVSSLVDKKAKSKPALSLNKKVMGATKVEAYGITFDSKIEQYMYALLHNSGISFEFQKPYILQEKFKYLNESVRAITLTVDFFLEGYNIIIDTKGHQTQQGALRWKMLKHLLKYNVSPPVVEMPKNRDECNVLVNRILYGK